MKKINVKSYILNSKGYTLIEMLAAIIVFSILGGIIAMIFTSSLRSSNKANIENEVRQNGNYALQQMSKVITYAKSFNGISTNGSTYIANCYIEPVPAGSPTPTPVPYHYLRVLDFDNNTTLFVCNNNSTEIASNDANLIDENLVKVDSCSFYCSQPSSFSSPVIRIDLELSQESQSNLFEHKASLPFETTVVMRNINP